ILEDSNSSLNDIVKITIYITKMDDFVIVNKVYKEFFKNIKVARSLLEVSSLPKNSKIMIDIIAFKIKK
ncbi:MAG: RidA family protein, partial [Cetobacterium sp.]